jgi:hypothetical protein
MTMLGYPHLGLVLVILFLVAFVAGQLVTTWRTDWQLERIPFLVVLFAMSLPLQFVLIAEILRPLDSQDMDVPWTAVVQLGLVLLTYALLGAAAAARSRDACGQTGAGFLLFVPLLNLWLLTAAPKSPRAGEGGWLRRQVTGANGFRLIAVLVVCSIASGIWYEKQAQTQAMEARRIAAERARAAAEAEAQARQSRLPTELEAFAAEIDVPYALNNVFTFAGIRASGTNLLIRVDASDWFVHEEADAHFYAPVFCNLPGIRIFLDSGVNVTIDIHDPDGTRAIEHRYDGSNCDE